MKLLNKLDIELVIKSLHNAPKEFKVDFASFEEGRGILTEVYILAGVIRQLQLPLLTIVMMVQESLKSNYFGTKRN